MPIFGIEPTTLESNTLTTRPQPLPSSMYKHNIISSRCTLTTFYCSMPFYDVSVLLISLYLVSSAVPQVILLGAPATGKEAIAKLICSKLRTANLNMTSLIEESESHLKNAVLEHQERNQVRPPTMCVCELVCPVAVPRFEFANGLSL